MSGNQPVTLVPGSSGPFRAGTVIHFPLDAGYDAALWPGSVMKPYVTLTFLIGDHSAESSSSRQVTVGDPLQLPSLTSTDGFRFQYWTTTPEHPVPFPEGPAEVSATLYPSGVLLYRLAERAAAVRSGGCGDDAVGVAADIGFRWSGDVFDPAGSSAWAAVRRVDGCPSRVRPHSGRRRRPTR